MTNRRRSPAPRGNAEQGGIEQSRAAGQRPAQYTTPALLWISPDWPMTACALVGCMGAVLAEGVRR